MADAEGPLILSFDIAPEFHRPTWVRVVIECGLGVTLLGLGGYGIAQSSAGGGLIAIGLAAVFGIPLLLMGVRDGLFGWSWRREEAAAERALRGAAPVGSSESDRAWLYRGVLMRNLHRPWKRRRLARELRAAGTPSPRALLVGSASWTSRPPRSVSPDLVEPELIRTSPRGWGLIRLIAGSILGLAVWLFFALFAFWLAWYGVTAREWWYAAVGAVGLLGVGVWSLSAVRGRWHAAPGMGELMAGPSRIEFHGLRRLRIWTPDDAVMLVRRARPRSPELVVELVSQREGAATFRFFGPDDPGFRTLWSMWIHPRRVDALTEG